MFTLNHEVRRHPQVVDTLLDDEVVLLHLESKIYFTLNLTGSHIWRGITDGRSLREIAERLEEQFEVQAQNAERSVLDLVDELAAHELIEIQG